MENEKGRLGFNECTNLSYQVHSLPPPEQNQTALRRNIDTGIGFLLKPALPELDSLSSLPASLRLADTLLRLLTPCTCTCACPYPIITIFIGFVPEYECKSFFVCVYVYSSLRGCLDRFIGGVVGVVGIDNFLDEGEERNLGDGLLVLLLKYARSLAEALRLECSSRMEPRVDELHLDLKTRCCSWTAVLVSLLGLEGTVNMSSTTVGAQRRSSSSPLAISASRSMGETGSDGSIITWLSSSSSMLAFMANWMSTLSNSNSSEVALSGKDDGVEGKDEGKGEGWEYMLSGLQGVGRVSYIEKENAEALSSEKA